MSNPMVVLALVVALPSGLLAQESLARARALYNENNLEAAYPLFREAVREAPEDPDVRAWLAETARRRRLYDEAHEAALAALSLAPCHAFAHTVLGFLYQPIYGGWEQTSADSSWHHLRRAVECDPADGNAWIAIWVEALRRDERTWERRAVESLVTTNFVPQTVLAYNRWVLESAPPNAVLLTNGDWDTFPALGLQVAEGTRVDVAVVNLSMLHLPWYVRLMADRHGLPLALTGSEMQELEGRPWALPDTVTHDWRRRSLSGNLDRPLAAATTVMQERLADADGAFQLAGPVYVLASDSVASDTTALRRALGAIDASDFAGPEVSPADRSAVRMQAASQRSMASGVLYIALRYAEVLLEAERRSDANAMIDWSDRFVSETGLGPEQREMVERLRRSAQRG